MNDCPRVSLRLTRATGGTSTVKLAMSTLTHMRRTLTTLACSLALCVSARAIVGDAEQADWRIVRPALMVAGPLGTCSGAVLGPDLVLTAAHCVTTTAYVEVAGYGTGWIGVSEIVQHPQFSPGAALLKADLALLKLYMPPPTGFVPALLGSRPVGSGERLIVVGYGLQDNGKRDNFARMATLTVTNQYDDKLGLTDQDAMGERSTRGGCGGDSGGPVFAARGGAPFLVGIVTAGSWCGGTTYVTPLTPYHSWITETARQLRSRIGP